MQMSFFLSLPGQLFVNARPVLSAAALGGALFASQLANARAVDPAVGIPVRPERVARFAAIVGEQAQGLGRTCNDRRSWAGLASQPAFQEAFAAAEKELAQPTPQATDDQFLAFTRTGDRVTYEVGYHGRARRLTYFVQAECLENKGRFLPAIERELNAILSERTWVMSAHDDDLVAFRGAVKFDLGVAMRSWTVSTSDYLLGARLRPATRARIRSEVRRRAIDPFLRLVRTGRSSAPGLLYELMLENNHSIVVLSGLVGSTLALADSRDDRGAALAAAEIYSRNFLRGYTDDGYCSEGLGYWNYGFGHYALLAEAVKQATGNQVDWWRDPKVQAIARFGARIEIQPGVYPAFADSSVTEVPERWLMDLVSHKLQLRLKEWEQGEWVNTGRRSIYYVAGVTFGDRTPVQPVDRQTGSSGGLRDAFPQGGAYVLRPGPGLRDGLAVALKGGHNDEWHNHNDVGSYVVAMGGKALLVDPGLEIYTARTFSPRRYDSMILNSYGHAVPVVAGKLQSEGRERKAVLTDSRLAPDRDTLTFDLTRAYDVSALQRLSRTFVYSRPNRQSFTITDSVQFTSPRTFSTALITFSSWRRTGPNTLLVFDGSTALKITIDTAGEKFAIASEFLDGQIPKRLRPQRIGVNLVRPVTSATVKIRIEPLL